MTARLDPALHTALADLAQARRATPFMAVQSAFAALLTRLGAGTDLPLGCPVDGRDDEALHDVIGLFVHTLVVRADTSGDPAFEELLDRVRDAVLDAHVHQDVPFESLVERLNPARSPSRHPLFQVAVAGQRGEGPAPELPGLVTEVEAVRTGTAKFDLTLEVDERRDPVTGAPAGIGLSLEYADDLFDGATAQALLDRLVRLTAEAVRDPAAPSPPWTSSPPGSAPSCWRAARAAPRARRTPARPCTRCSRSGPRSTPAAPPWSAPTARARTGNSTCSPTRSPTAWRTSECAPAIPSPC